MTLTGKAGEEGKLFGSITAQDIADALAAQGHQVDRRRIELEHPDQDARSPYRRGAAASRGPRGGPCLGCRGVARPPMTVGIAYVDGPRLARSLFAAADWVAAGPGGDQPDQRLPGPRRRHRHQLQPDPPRRRRRPPGARRRAASGDRAHDGPRRRARRPGQLRHDARPFPAGLRRVARRPATPRATRDVAAAVRQGADRLYESLDDPREGTILTVAREARGRRGARGRRDRRRRRVHAPAPRGGRGGPGADPGPHGRPQGSRGRGRGGQGVRPHARGRGPLHRGRSDPPGGRRPTARTPPRWSVRPRLSRSRPSATSSSAPSCSSAASTSRRPMKSGRRCTRSAGPSSSAVMADILKIHVHTDTPEAVFTYAARWGRVESTKADDMRAQHRRLAHVDRRPVAVVTDSSADLADSVLDRHRIAVVPLQVVFGDETFRDRIELKPEEFYRRLRDRPRPPYHLAADAGRLRPSPARCPERGGRGGRVSCSRAASRAPTPRRRRRCGPRESRVSAWWIAGRPRSGVGMLALRGAELAEAGWPARRISRRSSSGSGGSRACCSRSTGYDNLLRSGRVSRGQGLDRGDAGREADPVPRPGGACRPGGQGARPGAAGAPGAGAAREAAHAATPRSSGSAWCTPGPGRGGAGADGAGRGLPARATAS